MLERSSFLMFFLIVNSLHSYHGAVCHNKTPVLWNLKLLHKLIHSHTFYPGCCYVLATMFTYPSKPQTIIFIYLGLLAQESPVSNFFIQLHSAAELCRVFPFMAVWQFWALLAMQKCNILVTLIFSLWVYFVNALSLKPSWCLLHCWAVTDFGFFSLKQ